MNQTIFLRISTILLLSIFFVGSVFALQFPPIPQTNNLTGMHPPGGNTTASGLLVDGIVHLCGTIWDVDDNFIQQNSVCTELAAGSTRTCVYYEDSWVWRSDVETLIMNGTAAGVNYERFACHDGEVVRATEKLRPPPSLRTSHCPAHLCAVTTGCVPVGTVQSDYLCVLEEGATSATWGSKLIPLANEILRLGNVAENTPFTLHCSTDITDSINRPDADSQGYCQLTFQQSGRILIGAFLQEDASGQDLFDQIRIMHPNAPIDYDDFINQSVDLGRSFPYLKEAELSFAESSSPRAIIYTNADHLGGTGVRRAWSWLGGLFGRSNAEVSSTAAGQFFIEQRRSMIGSSTTNIASVDFVAGSLCPQGKEIIGVQEEPLCYSAREWSRIIQDRTTR